MGVRMTIPQPWPTAATMTRRHGAAGVKSLSAGVPTRPMPHQRAATTSHVRGCRRRTAGRSRQAASSQAYQPQTHQPGGVGSQTWPQGTRAPQATQASIAASAASQAIPQPLARGATGASTRHPRPQPMAAATSGVTITLSTIPSGLTT